jgi:hypothetical protein
MKYMKAYMSMLIMSKAFKESSKHHQITLILCVHTHTHVAYTYTLFFSFSADYL